MYSMVTAWVCMYECDQLEDAKDGNRCSWRSRGMYPHPCRIIFWGEAVVVSYRSKMCKLWAGQITPLAPSLPRRHPSCKPRTVRSECCWRAIGSRRLSQQSAAVGLMHMEEVRVLPVRGEKGTASK